MPTFKNIRIKMKNGKTRLQRVQVLASGKYKFVKNPTTFSKQAKRRTTTKRRSAPRKKVSNVGKGNSKMFRTLGVKGALEDFAWGFGGIMVMGQNPITLPTIRLVQGIQGHVFNRTGKGRLVYALIDLADLIIAGGGSMQDVFNSLRQLTKLAPIP